MTDAAHFQQHARRPPTRAGDAQGCGFCVQKVWEKACISTSV
jgi:hypothetical protein